MAVATPLAPSKLYHCSIFYNYCDGHKSRRDKDQQLSHEFVRHLERKLSKIGITKPHYFDNMLPGCNLFDELMSSMVLNADKIVVIFTKGFIDDHWHKYTHKNALKELLDNKESNKLLGISIGLNKTELPRELGVSNQHLVYFDDDWQNDDENWTLIRRFFLEERPIHELPQRLLSQTPVQESDGGIIETDGVKVSNKVDGAGESYSQSVDSDGLQETPPIGVLSDRRDNTNPTEKEDHKQDTAVQESDSDISETDEENDSVGVDEPGEANFHSVNSGEGATNSPETVPHTIPMRVQVNESPSLGDEIGLDGEPSISVSSAGRVNTHSAEKEDHKQDTAVQEEEDMETD